jgi:regulator of replication initiation timing
MNKKRLAKKYRKLRLELVRTIVYNHQWEEANAELMSENADLRDENDALKKRIEELSTATKQKRMEHNVVSIVPGRGQPAPALLSKSTRNDSKERSQWRYLKHLLLW